MSKGTRARWESQQALRVVGTAAEKAPQATLVTVSPKMAAAWLQCEDANNRASTPLRVSMYARDMRAGNWHLNGESIKFDVADVLIDGGHRLRAVVEAGCDVEMLVVRGASRDGIDRGRPRSASDSRRMRGEAVSSRYLAAMKVVRRLVDGTWLSAWTASISDDELRETEASEAQTADLLRAIAKAGKGNFQASVYGLIGYAYPTNPQLVMSFHEAIASGANLRPRSAPLALLRQLRTASGAGAQNGLKALLVTATALRNYAGGVEGDYIRGTEESVLYWRRARGHE